jgi:hypothetical protein
MNDKETTVDWVSRRSECSITAVFLSLKAAIERDVEVRNKISKETSKHYCFGFKDNGDSFNVFTEAAKNTKILDFKLTDHYITVGSNGNVTLKAGITLDSECECKLVVDGQEVYDWQFRKMALEALFFGER